MKAYCNFHKDTKTDKQCAQCYKPICGECINKYWHVNKISSMFGAQQEKPEELILCKNCLKKTKLRNILFTSFMLFIVFGLIFSMIYYAIAN